MEKIMKYLRKSFYLTFFVVMIFATFMSIFLPNLLAYDPNKNWINPFIKIFLAVIFTLLLLGINLLLRNMSKKQTKYTVSILICIIIGFQIYLSIQFWNQPLTDDNSVKLQAFNLANGVTKWPDYFSVFPNNINITIFYAAFIKILYLFSHNAVIIDILLTFFRFVIIDLTVYLGYLMLKRVTKNDGIILIIVSVLFLPFYCYAMYFYTDPVIILFPMLSLYVYSLLKSITILWKKVSLIILLFLILLLGILLKQNFVIFLIALIIYELFSEKINFKELIVKFICVCVFAIGVMGVSNITQKTVQKDVGFIQNTSLKMPSTFWMYMSLNPDLQGQFSIADQNQLMTYNSLHEKKDVAKNGIKTRVVKLGPKGLIIHFAKKMQTLVSIGSMDGLMYLPTTNHSPKIFRQGIHRIEFIIDNINQIVYISILSVITFYSFKQIFKKQDFMLIDLVNLFILGIILFHTLIWESESRYFLLAAPFLILSSCFSLNDMQKMSMKIPKLSQMTKIAIPMIIVISALGSFLLTKSNFIKSDNYTVTSQRTGVFDDFMVEIPAGAQLNQKFRADMDFNQVVIGVPTNHITVQLVHNGKVILQQKNVKGNVVLKSENMISKGDYSIVIINHGDSVKWHGPVKSQYFKLFDYPIHGLKETHIYPTFSVNVAAK